MVQREDDVVPTRDPKTAEPTSSLFEVHHPLTQKHLAVLRHASTGPPEFRLLIQRLAVLLAYEDTKDLVVDPIRVKTPVAVTTRHRLGQRGSLIPILRAELGMVDPLLQLLPDAEV